MSYVIKCSLSGCTHKVSIVLIESGDVIDHVLIAEFFVGLLSGERQNFPQRDGKRPDVAPRCVLVLYDNTHIQYDNILATIYQVLKEFWGSKCIENNRFSLQGVSLLFNRKIRSK